MRNFIGTIKSLRYTLIALSLFAFAFCTAPPAANGQIAPWANTFEQYSQMWSIGNTFTTGSPVYYNTVTTNNLGTQKDTFAAASTNYLYVAGYNPGACTVCTDTFTPKILYGTGTINFSVSALATNTITTVAVTLEQSLNGVRWVPVSGISTQSVTSTSKTTAVPGTSTAVFSVTTKQALQYRLKCVTVTDNAMVQGDYYLQRFFNFYKSSP